MKRLLFLFLAFYFMTGCTHVKEAVKQIWGSSISHLEKERPNGMSESFAMPLDACFQGVERIIIFYGGDVYLKDEKKRYLAAMGFKGSVDTTQVGIFFTTLDDNHTKVEVVSMSPRLMKRVAGFVFAGLKKPLAT